MFRALVLSTFLGVAMTGVADTHITGEEIPQMSDAEIVQILIALNEGEVNTSQIAVARALRNDVKEFATMMISAHRENNMATQRLGVKHNIRDQQSSISVDLKEVGISIARELSSKTGNDFDKAFIDRQVMMHEQALTTLHTKLIPRARIASLRVHLETTREAVIDHLEHARMLQDQL